MKTLKLITFPVVVAIAAASLLSACYVESRPAYHPYHRDVVWVRR